MLVTLASSINIIMGYTGYVSFGHIVFFGIGGYIAFWLMQMFNVHFLIAAMPSAIPAALIAALIGIPILRLRDAYFALATVGINAPGPAFDLLRSIESLVMVVLGGIGTVAGPIVGATLYEWLRGFLITNSTFANFQLAIAGLLLLLTVLFVTARLVGSLRNRFPRLRAYIQ